MKLLGRDTGELRLPMTPLTESEEQKLRKWMQDYGIDKSNFSKLKRGQSVPGRDGAYQYGKSVQGQLAWAARMEQLSWRA